VPGPPAAGAGQPRGGPRRADAGDAGRRSRRGAEGRRLDLRPSPSQTPACARTPWGFLLGPFLLQPAIPFTSRTSAFALEGPAVALPRGVEGPVGKAVDEDVVLLHVAGDGFHDHFLQWAARRHGCCNWSNFAATPAQCAASGKGSRRFTMLGQSRAS